MKNPLARSKGLDAYTVEELQDRAHELWEHNTLLRKSESYRRRYMEGEVPDPMEGYTRGDPWYDFEAIDTHLKGRLT